MSVVGRRLEMIRYYARSISPVYAALQVRCTIDSQWAIRTGAPFHRSVYARKDQWVQRFLRSEFAPLIERWAGGQTSDNQREWIRIAKSRCGCFGCREKRTLQR